MSNPTTGALPAPKQIRFVNNQGQPPSKRRRINAAYVCPCFEFLLLFLSLYAIVRGLAHPSTLIATTHRIILLWRRTRIVRADQGVIVAPAEFGTDLLSAA